MTDAQQPSKESATAPKTAKPTGPAPVVDAVIRVDVHRKRKRKRKYSRGLKDVQRWERGLAKGSRRVGRAVSAGLDRYFDRRERSSYKKRDGAIRDALKNWSKALGKTMRKASDAPYDVTKAFDTKSVRRTVKFGARTLALPFLR